MLPSLVIYAKVQHGNHNNPRLEGLFYVTKFGNPCKNPTWEPEQSKVGRSHVMLPSLVIYVKVQHCQQQKSKVGNSYIVIL